MISRRIACSNRADPNRRVRFRSPPSRSKMTLVAAAQVGDRNGCCAHSSAAGHTHSSSARIC
jgi:hypothetical protein